MRPVDRLMAAVNDCDRAVWPALAAERLTESGRLVQTSGAFLIHQWWLDPQGVGEVMAAMTGRE